MDDINFDDLDKAVKSALEKKATTTAPDPGVSQQVVAPEEVTMTAVTGEEAHVEVPQVAEADVQQAAPAVPSILPKRRGQFMDVVHPSSDMTSQVGVRPPLQSRRTTDIKPLDSSVMAAMSADESNKMQVASPSGGIVEGMVPTPEQTHTPEDAVAVESDWPDPLDMMAEPEATTNSSESTSAELEAVVPSIPPATEVADAKEPVATPFIEGTEVEKRPLNAYAEEAPEENTLSGSADHPAEVTPVPAELTPEVVSIESDDPTNEQKDLMSDDDQLEKADDTTGIAASISPQYKPQTTQLDESEQPRPVYDHEPITPPQKKSAGKKVGFYVLLVLLFAALGVAAGYAVWVLKLI